METSLESGSTLVWGCSWSGRCGRVRATLFTLLGDKQIQLYNLTLSAKWEYWAPAEMRKSVFPTRRPSASPSPRDFKCKAMSVSYLDGMGQKPHLLACQVHSGTSSLGREGRPLVPLWDSWGWCLSPTPLHSRAGHVNGGMQTTLNKVTLSRPWVRVAAIEAIFYSRSSQHLHLSLWAFCDVDLLLWTRLS